MLWTKAIKHNDASYKISVEQLKIKEDTIGCCLIVIIQDIIIDVPLCTSYYVLINLMTVHTPVYPLSERFCTLVLKRCVDSFLLPWSSYPLCNYKIHQCSTPTPEMIAEAAFLIVVQMVDLK